MITINHEDYEHAKQFAAKKVYYIPGMGVDCEKIAKETAKPSDLRKQYQIPQDAFVVLSVGEVNQNKNHKVILEAIHKLADKNIYYVICGRGNQAEALQNTAKEYGMENRLKLVGFQKNIPEWLSIADIFAFPSMREGLPVSLMEAMAAGKPCVASKIRGNTDLLQGEQQRFLIAPDNAEAFAAAIAELKDNPSHREVLGKENRENIKRFDLLQVKKTMTKIYEEVIK